MDILAYYWTPGPAELSVILFTAIFIAIFNIVPVIAFWKICSRVGLPAPLGLVMLVPIANMVLMLYVAFADWPVMKKGG